MYLAVASMTVNRNPAAIISMMPISVCRAEELALIQLFVREGQAAPIAPSLSRTFLSPACRSSVVGQFGTCAILTRVESGPVDAILDGMANPPKDPQAKIGKRHAEASRHKLDQTKQEIVEAEAHLDAS